MIQSNPYQYQYNPNPSKLIRFKLVAVVSDRCCCSSTQQLLFFFAPVSCITLVFLIQRTDFPDRHQTNIKKGKTCSVSPSELKLGHQKYTRTEYDSTIGLFGSTLRDSLKKYCVCVVNYCLIKHGSNFTVQHFPTLWSLYWNTN